MRHSSSSLLLSPLCLVYSIYRVLRVVEGPLVPTMFPFVPGKVSLLLLDEPTDTHSFFLHFIKFTGLALNYQYRFRKRKVGGGRFPLVDKKASHASSITLFRYPTGVVCSGISFGANTFWFSCFYSQSFSESRYMFEAYILQLIFRNKEGLA